jgi:phosphonoacetate hydrolase
VTGTASLPPATAAARDRALDVLLGAELEPIVDMVGWSPGVDRYQVASADGSVRFRRHRDGFEVEEVSGRNPLATQDVTSFGSLADERRMPHPHRRDNSYPHGYEQFAQLFDHPSAPDLCVVHSAAHHWAEQGGHLGEHGSPGVTQARAPFVAAGAGVRALGLIDGSCQLVDVAPTVLALLGGGRMRRQDGTPLTEVLDGRGARHVVGLLFDGTNANVLYELASAGDAPNVARLMSAGVAYRHGAISSLPTVTLANHTSILTGAHPGHHGILHNAWVDRASGEQVITNSPLTWSTSMRWLDPAAETLHTALKRTVAGAVTASINEPCDAGADFSTFDFVRRGEELERPPSTHELPDATERFVRPSKDYRWSSRADHTAVEQFCGLWSGSYRGRDWPVPTFTWVNFTLTDAAFHEGGPYSEMAAASVRDTDARLGRILDAVERSGRWEDTAFVLVADHGMGETDPAVRGDWDVELRRHGIGVRDEGYGFLYLT